MESTGAHHMEAAMPSVDGGLRRRRREAKTIDVKQVLGQNLKLELDLSETIADVKAMIYEQEGTHPMQQVLIFSGQRLSDHHRTLADYGVQHGPSSALYLVKLLPRTVPVNEGSSHSHDPQSSGTQSQALVAGHEGRNEQMESSSETEEPPSMVVNNTTRPTDQFIKQQQIRWSKYSVKSLVFAITMLVTYLGSPTTLFSTGNMVFKISIGAFFITDAMLSIMMPPKMGNALVYLSCFLLVLVSYLLLVSFNKYYGYAILPAPLPMVAVLLQHKLPSGLMGQQRINSEGDQQNVNTQVSGQAHDNGEEDEEHFDRIFELSADIVNCGGLITVVFGNSMVGPVSAVGFLFFYTTALGLYLMMVTTVRAAVLTPHARYLAILLKVLLVITLITALIHGIPRSKVSSA